MIKKTGTILVFIFLIAAEVVGQLTYTSPDNTAGLDWDDVSTWTRTGTGGGGQTTPENPTHSSLNGVNIFGFVIVNDALVIANNSPLVIVNDTLFIKGDLTLNQGNLSVPAGGVLIIDGNLNAGNGLGTLSSMGTIAVTGDFNLTNGAVTTNDNFYVYGSSTVSGGATINGKNPFGGPEPTDDLSDELDFIEDNPGLHDFIAAGGVLPIELLSFSIFAKKSEVTLQWATASEENNSHFTIQKSFDGLNFFNLSEVPGADDSNEVIEYQYRDNDPIRGLSYYRLQQTDFDGTTTTFKVLSIEFLGAGDFINIYPNPVSDGKLNVSSLLNDFGNTLVIYDYTGNKVFTETLNSGTNEFDLSSYLRNGIYFVQVRNALGTELTKQRLVVN